MELWPHQQRALDELYPKLTPGAAVCVAAPTGAGKTMMMTKLLELGRPAILYTNRRMLLDQTADRLRSEGYRFGVRAAGHEPNPNEPIQLASIQTDDSRVLKRDRWGLHRAELVLIDEAHVNKEATACEIVRRYREAGATVIGFTATPLGIGHLYDSLVVAGTTSELQGSGVLVKAFHYGPDEPDTRKIKRTKTGEFKQSDIVKAIMTHSIFGRVVEHWHALNPEQKPTLLFAPGVKESLWFAEQLTANGIPAAHIDGNDIWIDGRAYPSSQEARDELKRKAECGYVKVVCNRFVLREGIDWPFVEHMIFATIFGALTSYLQSGGRGLRACKGKSHVTVQDHGGNWWRHGSLNSDREWALNRTDYMVSEAREEKLRTRKEPEPICCPKCFQIRLSGAVCFKCGYFHQEKSRMVVQHDGSLREMQGDIFKPRRTDNRNDVAKRWERYYHRFKRADMTFNQARGCYAYENDWKWPPDGLPLMPKDEMDWFRSVREVPHERLVQP